MSHKPLEQWADEQAEARYVENQAIARDNRVLRSQLREREEELERIRKRLGIYESIDAAVIAPPKWLAPKKAKGAHKAIPSLLLTDIHWGERINPEEVGGINAYDTAIAEQRIHQAATGAVKLCRDYLAGVEYEGLNLMLGGDLLSGDIHEELSQTNDGTTVEGVVGVMDALIAAVRTLADFFGPVHIAAVVGNHGRRTRKPRAKKRAADNYDGLVYQLIAREVRQDDRITMQIATAADIHFNVYSTAYCLTHGDQFRGGSGISGALAPLMLGVHRKRRRDATAGTPWDVICMGHWHNSYYLKDIIVGGSVVGYNEYAYVSNFVPEEPMAAMWLNTPERGISTYAPVHLMDRQAEGW